MLSTNEILAGITAVIGFSNLIAGGWLTWTLAGQIRRLRKKPRHLNKSAVAIVMASDPLRITLGFILKTIVIGGFFLLRIPLRVMRDKGLSLPSTEWLHATVYWELPGMCILLLGLSLIMWPAFTKWAPLRRSIPVALFGVAAMFAFGAFGFGWISDQLK